jgi:hypothetical protein
MHKDYLLELTIKQLCESLNSSPECFELHWDPRWPSADRRVEYTIIAWKFKVHVDGKTILDPNNSPRTIILTYVYRNKTLKCDIYFRDVEVTSVIAIPDASIEITYRIPILNKSYRAFSKFRKMLLNKIKHKEAIDYVKKLSSIFPSALDDNFLR